MLTLHRSIPPFASGVLLLLAAGCHDAATAPDHEPLIVPAVEFSIDGQKLTQHKFADSAIAVGVAGQGPSYILANLTWPARRSEVQLQITLPKHLAIGRYEFGTMAPRETTAFGSIQYQINADTAALFFTSTLAQAGTLTITSYDHGTGYLEGTFTFTAWRIENVGPFAVRITDGRFAGYTSFVQPAP